VHGRLLQNQLDADMGQVLPKFIDYPRNKKVYIIT
jgi:hypothetical protein